jgi:hypothetical protein
MEYRGTPFVTPSNPNPVGSVGPGGQFFNPAATPVMTANVLPVLPRQTYETAPLTASLKSLALNANAGARAIAANNAAGASQPSVPVVNNAPGAGSEGSSGNVGAPIALNPEGTSVAPVQGSGYLAYGAALYGSAIKEWQRVNPTLSLIGRFGLPIGAILLWQHGHTFSAIGTGGIAAILWVNR